MKNSQFRMFCTEKWYEHKDEILSWTGKALTEYDSNYYFQQHRWLLKSMYLEQYARDNARSIQKKIKRSMKGGNL